jgi:DNA polymerase-3 subunit delta
MDSLTFLERVGRLKPQPVYVLYGDEDFLKRQVLAALRQHLLGTGDDTFGLSSVAGDKATFPAVQQELQTVPFLSPRRLVVVENADPFVSRARAALEKYVTDPAVTGVLVLDVKAWPATTRLAKQLGDAAVGCKAPAANRLAEWCVQWAAARHDKQLTAQAARHLVDLVGAEMGQLDQELEKLAAYAGPAERIDFDDVDKLVGSSRMESVFKIFDAVGAGRTADALALLQRLLDQGDEPLRILGAFSMKLRRLVRAYRLNQRGRPLGAALAEAGVPPFAASGGEQQLRHLGRRRAEQLYDWLLEIDMGLKGSSQLPPRTLLERFVVRLAQGRAG